MQIDVKRIVDARNLRMSDFDRLEGMLTDDVCYYVSDHA